MSKRIHSPAPTHASPGAHAVTQGHARRPRRPDRTGRKESQLRIEIAEREKRGVARHLHDGLLQTLSAASILSRVVAMRASQTGALPAAEFARLQETIDSAVDEARLFIRQLQLPGVEPKSMIAAFEDLAGSVRPPCAYEFAYAGARDITLKSPTVVAVFRIAQEAVRSSALGPGVSRIECNLRVGGGRLRLEVQDNGRSGRHTPDREQLQAALMMEIYASAVDAELRTEYVEEGRRVTCSCPL